MSQPSAPRIGKFRLTARADAPDFRDFLYRPALIALQPESPVPADLNIRNQSTSGACTGFALAAVIDRLLQHCGMEGENCNAPVSARMLYEMARRHDEWAGEDYAGSSCRGAIKGWYNMGVCRESLYPFDPRLNPGWSLEAARDARNCTVGAYYRLGTRVSDYHAALNEVGAVLCSATLHDGWQRPDPQTGRIRLQEQAVGGHAFAIVGYDRAGFWIQNSWGEEWGLDGVALWTYEDWQLNMRDAWVFQLALPTPQIWHLPRRAPETIEGPEKQQRPTRSEIAGHFVHIDDGRFQQRGRYWSNLDDVRLTANHVAGSDMYDHLLFYAHGGLNSPADSARRIAAMKQTFKANRIYPYHLMYDTGILEELKDVVVGRKEAADARAGGLADWIDLLIEQLTRVPGRALWREMKAGAALPFTGQHAGTEILQAFVEAIVAAGKPIHIHVAGHSTGAILLAHLVQRLSAIAPWASIRTSSLLAPAATVSLFTDILQPYLKAPYPGFRISEMAIYNLTDRLEQADSVAGAYNKSMLYLVSRAFEDNAPAGLIGMQKYSRTIGRRNLPRLTIYYSSGTAPGRRSTASTSHAGFDNDPVTMNHILRRIVRSAGQQPVKQFTRKSLDY